MSIPLSTRDWLIIAFEEPIDRINESYYFDRRDNQFFSIFITDYLFLTDTESTIDPPYTDPEMDILYDRIGRIDSQDPLIVEIPRLNISERKQMLFDFFNSNPDFCDRSDIERIVNNEPGKHLFKISDEFNQDALNKWDIYKSGQIINKVETFLNLSNINIESATLWTDKKVTRIEFDLKKKETPKKPKAWWKFW